MALSDPQLDPLASYGNLADDYYRNSVSSYYADMDPYVQRANAQTTNNTGARTADQTATTNALNTTTASNNGLVSGLQGNNATLTGQGNDLLAGYYGQLGAANAQDAQNVGTLTAQAGGMRQLTAGGYGADVTVNPQDAARQEAAYGQYGDWAAGGHDISSDPGLVGAQTGVLNDFGDWAAGAHDLTSSAATAAADPEALAAQKYTMGELKDRSDPRLTDAERSLYLQNRLAQEQSNRANRDANMHELERTGMGGSTMQLSNLNASSSENATVRQVGDLGANAAAIKRAEAALVNYGNLGSTVAGQSFQRDFMTKNAADEMGQFNNQERFAGTQAKGTMATNMRNADDNIRQGNQGLQFAGAQAQGNEANQIRTANDALSTFNKSQSLQQQRFQDSYAADQQNAAWGRDTDVSNAGFRQSENTARNATNATVAGQHNIDSTWGRATDTTNAGFTANRDLMTGTANLATQNENARRGAAGDLAAETSNANNAAGLRQNALNTSTNIKAKATDQAFEDQRAQNATEAAAAELARQRSRQNTNNVINTAGGVLFPFVFKPVS